jgi:hypothetical protein
MKIKSYKECNEKYNNEDVDDINHIEDILIGLKDFGIDINIIKDKLIGKYILLIRGTNLIPFESFGELSSELNDCIKSISNFVKDFQITFFDISNRNFNGDGETTKNLNIYIYIVFDLN